MPYLKPTQDQRLPGLLALLIAFGVVTAVVTLTEYAINEGRKEPSCLREA